MPCDELSGQICDEDDSGELVGGNTDSGENTGAIDDGSGHTGESTTDSETHTSIIVSDINNSINTTSSNIMGSFITLLPAVAGVIGVIFAIKFISFWLKKYKKGR